eukprot:CAMPEP_0202866508 /NCGR_PEP_ID=MMETSP1391-20130828/7791_1 /ASSEMBLY_ACC=CAM_ASM_000867 /TAXON_ID=1034604 /ORGANISM="Chlamydomonas leiostraca, Strain SAG 11-49" /LENGTH=465 /DNA_ID=CAMNT_0049546461 /DNA_START=308 /DNA_END=1705 /DNA_ORIENTATION=-
MNTMHSTRSRYVMRVLAKDAPDSQSLSYEPEPVPSSAPKGRSDENNSGTAQPSKDPWGYAALFGVAVLWGSYTPALRFLYLIDSPPDPPLLNALQACLSAVFLITANITASVTDGKVQPRPERANPLMAEDTAVRDATMRKDEVAMGLTQDVDELDPPRRAPSNPIEHAFAVVLNWRSSNIVLAGGEIGLWMCLAFGLEVAGVQLTSATKAAFLNQVSVLITPLLVHLSGEHVRVIEWMACALGLLGSGLVAADSFMSGAGNTMEGGGMLNQSNEILGLTFVLASAVFFALSTVRLGRYSSRFNPLKLSTASTCSLGLLSLAWVVSSVIGRTDGFANELAVLDGMLASPSCLAVLLWVGLGPGALAAFLQATGQKSVPPAQAQVIYSTTPLWAAGFAILALDASDEAMGSIAWLGAAVMLGSSLMTALIPASTVAPATFTVSSKDSMDKSMDVEVKERQGLKDVI